MLTELSSSWTSVCKVAKEDREGQGFLLHAHEYFENVRFEVSEGIFVCMLVAQQPTTHFLPSWCYKNQGRMERKRRLDLDDGQESPSQKRAVGSTASLLEGVPVINPLNGRMYTDKYRKIYEQRKKLPVWQHLDQLDKFIKSNQVVIVEGETGSGKTTQVRSQAFDCTRHHLHPCVTIDQVIQFADSTIPRACWLLQCRRWQDTIGRLYAAEASGSHVGGCSCR